MVDSVHDNIVLNKCIKDILALIKPVEDDRSKRLSTIQELENCIHSLASLSGNLYLFLLIETFSIVFKLPPVTLILLVKVQ